jgi:hypothetical protein
MQKKLFTERHGGTKPRVQETLDDATRNGLLANVNTKFTTECLGYAFPFECQDGQGNAGCDTTKLQTMMAAFGVIWPDTKLDGFETPTDPQMFDLLEYVYEHVAEPSEGNWHSFWHHFHYSYDVDAGRTKFEQEVNRIFERNGIAYNLQGGEVVRIAPAFLDAALAEAMFKTGDPILDDLLEVARHKFLNRELSVRTESLEKLWDAWERLKTVEPGKDKKASASLLLDKASAEPVFRKLLDEEAFALTATGNKFMIRHTETDKVPVAESAHVDYLFHRMFSLLRLLLRSSGRGG